VGPVKRSLAAADGDQVDPAAIPSRPLGQLLVEHGVITADQLEQVLSEHATTNRPLADIIIERRFANRETVDAALGAESGQAEASAAASNVIAFASTHRGRPSSETVGDAEWRRKLFGISPDEDEHESAAPTSRVEARDTPRDTPGGIRGKLARSLEAYLARTAAELDERGEALQRRSIALDEEMQRIADAEAVLESRAVRIRELNLADRQGRAQIDGLLGLVADRDEALAEISIDRDSARRELERVQDELETSRAVSAERDRMLSASERKFVELSEELDAARARGRQDERTLAEREESLAELEQANKAQLGDIAALQGALAEARDESAQRERVRASVEVERTALEEELQRTRDQVQTLRESLTQRDQMVAQLDEANEAQLRDLASAQRRMDEHVTRISEHERKLDERHAELSAARRKLQDLEQEKAGLASTYELQQRELEERRAAIGDLQTRFEEAQRQQAEVNVRLSRLTTQLGERDERLSELLERVDEHEHEVQRLRQGQSERETAFDSVVAELAERQRLLLVSESKAAALAEQLDAVRASLRAIDGETGAKDHPVEREGMLVGDRPGEATHLCFVPLAGSYTLVERLGPLPKPGDQVTDSAYGGQRFVVSRVGRSPLPLDPRMCVFLEVE
jgi:chromosome segregation ATPase